MPGYHPTVTSYQESVTGTGIGPAPLNAAAPISDNQRGYGGYGPAYAGPGYGPAYGPGYGPGPAGYGSGCNPLGYCPTPRQSVNTRYYTYGIRDIQTRQFTPVRLTGVSGAGPGYANGLGAGAVYGGGGYGGY